MGMTKRGAKRTGETKRGCVSNCSNQNMSVKGVGRCQAAMGAGPACQRKAWIPHSVNVQTCISRSFSFS